MPPVYSCAQGPDCTNSPKAVPRGRQRWCPPAPWTIRASTPAVLECRKEGWAGRSCEAWTVRLRRLASTEVSRRNGQSGRFCPPPAVPTTLTGTPPDSPMGIPRAVILAAPEAHAGDFVGRGFLHLQSALGNHQPVDRQFPGFMMNFEPETVGEQQPEASAGVDWIVRSEAAWRATPRYPHPSSPQHQTVRWRPTPEGRRTGHPSEWNRQRRSESSGSRSSRCRPPSCRCHRALASDGLA